jgi:hypothetical protein
MSLILSFILGIKMKEREYYYYNKVVKLVKEVVDDDELTDEEKVRLLGVIL